METSAPALKRVPAAAPATPRQRRAERLRNPRPLPAGRKRHATSGATPAARSSTSTTRSTSRTPSSTCWCATSRRRCTPPTAMRARPARSASRWSRPGPGVTNAVTGIATAYMDSIPMVIITGQVPTPAIGLDAFQECDTVGITRPIVKHNFLVKDVRDLALTMKKAFHIARTGRPGPGAWSTSRRTSRMATRAVPLSRRASRCARTTRCKKGHGGQIRKAVQLLLGAKRPYIYTGGGVVLGNASAELRALVDLLGFPCTNTLMGLGALSGERPEVPRHARHARHLRSEHDDAELRRAARRRRALRRPRDRQPEALRVGRAQDHPHRHRSVVDLQARARSTSRSSATSRTCCRS